MTNKIILAGAVSLLCGCISIETPEHLVADTIEAGKEVYYSVKGKVSDEEVAKTNTFTHQYLVPDGELMGESSGKCINHALESARKALNIYNINIQQTSATPKTLNGQSFLECSITVGA